MNFLKFSSLMDSVKSVRKLIRRNIVSVIFPTFAVVTIYADLRRTARWKRELAVEKETQEIAAV